MTSLLSDLVLHPPRIQSISAEYFVSLQGGGGRRSGSSGVLSLTLLRKELVYLARSRISCVVHLVNVLPQNRRIIIFSERIETAEEIYRRLTQLSPGEAGIYHSKLPKELRRNTLRRFENREIRILVSCKTLDEGLNIPEADAGIIVSSTGSRRQRIQRLGRVLRKKSHDRMVCLYYLFIRDSSEEEGLLAEMTGNHIDG